MSAALCGTVVSDKFLDENNNAYSWFYPYPLHDSALQPQFQKNLGTA